MTDPICYIGGKFSSRLRLRTMRASVRAQGFVCESSWMDEDGWDYPVPRERALAGARRDIAEVAVADLFVLDTLDETPTGGREVEFGLYLRPLIVGATAPIVHPAILIGPVRNVFHELAEWRCRDWSDGLETLADLRTRFPY